MYNSNSGIGMKIGGHWPLWRWMKKQIITRIDKSQNTNKKNNIPQP